MDNAHDSVYLFDMTQSRENAWPAQELFSLNIQGSMTRLTM